MEETVGNKLKQARTAKGLSLEDAAHHTKIRLRSLADLENDDFSNFPNLVYARGFLLLYARYLEVDITPYLDQFESGSAVSLEGYEYLATGKSAPRSHDRPEPSRSPSPLPLVLFAVLFIVAAVGWLVVSATMKRLEDAPPPVAEATPEVPEPIVAQATPVPALPLSTPVPTPNNEVMPEVRRAIPVGEAVPLDPLPPSTAPEYELEIRPAGTTTVRVVKNEPGTEPAFEGVLDTESEPLIFRGNRFWLTVGDAASVDVRRNGQPVPLLTNEILLE